MQNSNNLIASSKRSSWGEANRQLLKLIRQYAYGKILDAGCARGMYVQALNELGYETYGGDLFDWPEWHAHSLKSYSKINLLQLPFRDQIFDTVICINVLEHIVSIQSALSELTRVCKNNGTLFLAVPNCAGTLEMDWAGLTYSHWIDRSHVHFFTEQALQNLLTECNLICQTLVQFGNISPEILFLRSFGVPFSIARAIAAGFQRIPGRRRYAPLLVAVVEVNH
jgi:SAM-dependent methyltransferase